MQAQLGISMDRVESAAFCCTLDEDVAFYYKDLEGGE